jgi:iron complex transport system substrate-binding protein
VNLPESPQRIVSLAPNITEILFEVGAGPSVVAVTRFCDFPQEVTALPRIGGLIDPDVESIASHRPDLVIGVTSGGNPNLTKALDALKIPYVFVKMETLDETVDGILTVASVAGQKAEGQKVQAAMRQSLEKFAKYPRRYERKVLVVFGHNPIIGAGPGTFAHDLVTLAGGTNVLEGTTQPYPNLDIETIIKLNPDRILDLSMGTESADDFWDSFESIEAVHSGNVFVLSDPALMRPGPRLVSSLQHLALAIHGKHTAH